MGNRQARRHNAWQEIDITEYMPAVVPDPIPVVQLSSAAIFYKNTSALRKLRANYVSRLSKVPKDVFRCILEYCEPYERITDHYKYNPKRPINYRWPKEVSYQNPISAIEGHNGYLVFKLKSGEITDSTESNGYFRDLDWTEVTSLKISFL